MVVGLGIDVIQNERIRESIQRGGWSRIVFDLLVVMRNSLKHIDHKLGVRIGGNRHAKSDAPQLVGQRPVHDLGADELGIRDDHCAAVARAYGTGAEADSFDLAGMLSDFDEIANLEASRAASLEPPGIVAGIALVAAEKAPSAQFSSTMSLR